MKRFFKNIKKLKWGGANKYFNTHPFVEGCCTNAKAANFLRAARVQVLARLLHQFWVNGADVTLLDALQNALAALTTE